MALCQSCKLIPSGGLTFNLLYAIIVIGLASCLPSVSAFGSGNIPDAAYLKGKAWRHGDIEDTLEGLAKVAGQSGGAIVGAIASALLGGGGGRKVGFGGKKFTGLDVKRIYFGNWLRDLSQVCDIAGFKAMTGESLVICIMTMGFLSFGYATREFQVTRERLAVYLLTEHIDNPKGYGEGEDPQKYDPRLRPRVDEERELRIDERNGMKMYIASDDQGFDTSTACIRRVFRQCIQIGREAQREGSEEKEHEALRMLGQGLHTIEDMAAHSNWCELALQKLGYKEVFAHVGENVKVNSPDGPVPPLVTGTFAGADFCFSMLGEAGDKLSSASISDLTASMDDAQTENKKPGGINLDFIKNIMSKLPLGGGDSGVDNDLDAMDKKKQAFDLDGRIDQVAPEDLQKKLWDLFVVRDNLMRRIETLIEGIPGLGDFLDKLSLSLAQWIMVTIDPFVRPILLQASTAIGQGGQAVISGNDQWTVFNDPNASDPTHSVLAKDHFSNILNDPAGNISVIMVKYTVGLMVEAWSSDENPDRVIDRILESIHHPNFANRTSTIQQDMLDYMRNWLQRMDEDDRKLTISSLTKDSIRNHRNHRKTSAGGADPRVDGNTPHSHSHPAYQQSTVFGSSQPQSSYGSTAGRPTKPGGYADEGRNSSAAGGQYSSQQGRQDDYHRGASQPKSDAQYGGQPNVHHRVENYGAAHGRQTENYGSQQTQYSGRASASPAGQYGAFEPTGGRRDETYGSTHGSSYSRPHEQGYDSQSRPGSGRMGYGGESYESSATGRNNHESVSNYGRPVGGDNYTANVGGFMPSSGTNYQSGQNDSNSYGQPSANLGFGDSEDNSTRYDSDARIGGASHAKYQGNDNSSSRDERSDRYNSPSSIPHPRHESQEAAYRAGNAHESFGSVGRDDSRPAYDSGYNAGNSGAYGRTSSRDDDHHHGQKSRSHSREKHGHHGHSDSRERGGERYVSDSHHRSSDSSSDSEHKKHHKHNKHSKSNDRHRGEYQSSYGAGRDGQSDNANNERDSDYGMNRLNMGNHTQYSQNDPNQYGGNYDARY